LRKISFFTLNYDYKQIIICIISTKNGISFAKLRQLKNNYQLYTIVHVNPTMECRTIRHASHCSVSSVHINQTISDQKFEESKEALVKYPQLREKFYWKFNGLK